MSEVWRPVVGYEGLYEVSDQGRVRAPAKWTKGKAASYYLREPRILKQSKHRYWSVCLYREAVGQTRLVHQLVVEAFIGPRPEGNVVICHGPGGVDDNSLLNLRYDSQIGNLADREEVGTVPRGGTHGMAKLTEADVIYIREQVAAGAVQTHLAKEFGVTKSLIGKIHKRVLWKHI